MDITSDPASFREQSLDALKGLTRVTNQLTAQDLAFHRSLDPTIGPAVDEQGTRILGLTSDLLRCASGKKAAPQLTDDDSVEDSWRNIVDVIDGLLEKADACLDEFTGLIKGAPENEREQRSGADAKPRFPSTYDRTSRIAKPQLQFEHAPDNQDTSPWKPLLRSKPHATVSLSESLEMRDGSYRNPYEREIKESKYPAFTYAVQEPKEFLPFDSTTATFVDSLDEVKKMLSELREAKEIAVDLEHHDTHSYQGIVCLMQISTRDKDWIVDTLKPWREELQILNEVFANPNILKVFHGAFMDIIWLQRDLGIYVVNLFDTFHASTALGFSKRSLKFLLEKFVNFQAEKQYQTADWRLRPLLPGMFDYARSDTHYLLYIYDCLRNDLVENSDPENNLVDYVSEKSKDESLQHYERPTYDPETGKGTAGWFDLLCKTSVLFSKEQFAVFKAVHRWRDEIARTEDEGLQYVLAKHALFRIAHSMPLDAVSLLRAAAPVSPVVRAHVQELVEVVKKAKLEGANGPELRDVLHPMNVETSRTISRVPSPAELRDEDAAKVERADESQFWGASIAVPESASVDTYAMDAVLEAFQLSLPMPKKLEVEPESAPVEQQPQPAQPTAEKKPTPKKPTNDVFTVKQFGAGKKRKHSSPDAASPSSATELQPDPMAIEESVQEGATGDEPVQAVKQESKNQRRKRRKAEKRALAQRELELAQQGPTPEAAQQQSLAPGAGTTAAGASVTQPPASNTPFDYSKAETVLHSKPGTAVQPGDSKKKKKKNFNYYAKATDTSTGLGRIKRDTSGRSHTFS